MSPMPEITICGATRPYRRSEPCRLRAGHRGHHRPRHGAPWPNREGASIPRYTRPGVEYSPPPPGRFLPPHKRDTATLA